jgi:hypothetical protein
MPDVQFILTRVSWRRSEMGPIDAVPWSPAALAIENQLVLAAKKTSDDFDLEKMAYELP